MDRAAKAAVERLPKEQQTCMVDKEQRRQRVQELRVHLLHKSPLLLIILTLLLNLSMALLDTPNNHKTRLRVPMDHLVLTVRP